LNLSSTLNRRGRLHFLRLKAAATRAVPKSREMAQAEARSEQVGENFTLVVSINVAPRGTVLCPILSQHSLKTSAFRPGMKGQCGQRSGNISIF
jgi:hypothetical protein